MINRYNFFSTVVSLLLILNFSCVTVKKVDFKTPVNTLTRHIDEQIKRTYHLSDLGISASNEFDGARLNDFKTLNDSTAVAVITPENSPINNSAYYAFNIWSETPKTAYIQFNYPKNHKHRYIPKIRHNSRWEVLDSSNVFKVDSIVTIKLNLTQKPITIAAQELQISKDVEKWYTGLIKNKPYANLENFGTSVLGRKLPVLNISKGSQKEKPIIVLLTRQHPPEVTGYYAFQEFLTTILSGSDLANNFLERYHVLAFPIMNPDGVDLGHWRHNAGGVDTNRDWSMYNQPEIKQAVTYITKQAKKNKAKILLGIDFHSTWHDVFYTNIKREGTTLPNFIDDWFKALESKIDNYKVNEVSGNSSKPVSKGWFLNGHNAVGITYEMGDATPKDQIETIGKTAANEMMRILLKK